ncbi:MAG: hypothetical protein ACNA8W_21565, partial [Bradymonadaceae bacterium]
SQSCVVGCRNDTQCTQSGQICDESSETCVAGCRLDTDCAQANHFCDESTWTCLVGCRDNDDCPVEGEVCFASGNCGAGCGEHAVDADGGCKLTGVCGMEGLVFSGGDCSFNHDDFAHWWCRLAGYNSAVSYDVVNSGSYYAFYYTGGADAVLTECTQILQDYYGHSDDCTGVRELVCQH